MIALTSPPAVTPTPASAADPRARLRSATAPLHAQVDARMPLAGPAPGLGDYLAHLRVLRDWLGMLRLAASELPGLAAEQGAVARDADQAARLLGEPLPAPTAQPGPAARRLIGALAGTDADAAGWRLRYVIEGSHLGGQVLQRRLAAALAPHPLDYLKRGAAADGVPAAWPVFLQALAERQLTPSELDIASDAAVGAFEVLLECLPAQAMDARAT